MSQKQEKITFKILPHTQGSTFSFKFSKKRLKIIILAITAILVSLVGGLYYYYRQHQLVRESRNQLITHKQERYSLENENETLSKKLTGLYDIMDRFEKISIENRKLREKIDFDDSIDMDDIDDNISDSSFSDDIENIAQVGFREDEESEINFSRIEDRRKLADDVGRNIESLNQALAEKESSLSELEEGITRYNDYLDSKPEGWPVEDGKGRISATFGYRIHPILDRKIHHNGVDIAIWYNYEIEATGAGEVVFSGDRGGFGRVVIIDHGYNYRTLYAHNNKLLVDVGDKVDRGDTIALSGSSGRSTGPHLHYEVHKDGKHTDPMDYME